MTREEEALVEGMRLILRESAEVLEKMADKLPESDAEMCRWSAARARDFSVEQPLTPEQFDRGIQEAEEWNRSLAADRKPS
jgi:hypothetical protein